MIGANQGVGSTIFRFWPEEAVVNCETLSGQNRKIADPTPSDNEGLVVYNPLGNKPIVHDSGNDFTLDQSGLDAITGLNGY